MTANATPMPNAAITAAAASRADRPREVERDGVEARPPAAASSSRDERADERHLRGLRERRDDAEERGERDHDRRRRMRRPRDATRARRTARRRALGHEQQPPAVEPVGHATRPRARAEDGRELEEVEDAEQERRVRQPVDEDRRGEVLEPGAAGGGGVPDEVRPEVPLTQDAPGRPGAGGCVRPQPCLHDVVADCTG